MSLSIEPVRHIEALDDEDGRGNRLWRSTGDDPGFLIRLPLLRDRFLHIRLHGHGHKLAPQLYFDFGGGFRERDSVTLAEGCAIALVVDVGRMGFIRSIRLDPCDGPATFSCEIEAVANAARARERLADWAGRIPEARTEWIDHVGLIWRTRRKFASLFRRRALAEHLEGLYRLAERETARSAFASGEEPWLSIVVPTFNTPPRYLDDLLRSFRDQEVGGVELIFSDDASTSEATLGWLRRHQTADLVRVVFNASNAGIAEATNAGLAIARGTWVAFLDHDDLIAPHGLKMVRRTLTERPGTRFLYTDEVVVDGRLKPRGLMAKPAYDPVLLSGMNYINHFSFYRRERLEELGRLRGGLLGSQDYDLVLRYLDGLEDREILHLPYPAYWWRRDGKTYTARFMDEATRTARIALTDHFRRRGQEVQIAGAITPTLHRIGFAEPAKPPRISVIIPSKNAFELITTAVGDLLKRTDYPDLEILILDNGSEDPRVLDFYDGLTRKHGNVAVERRQEPFNFARSVNRGFALASGEHFLLLNNDISVLHPDWLTEMVSCLNYDRAGIVGAKLLFPDSRIQHAGVIAGFGGLAGHWYLGKEADFGGPMNRLHIRSSMTCVTAAAMLISGECRAAVGDMDEENFAVAYNDVDYCLRAYEKRFRTIWTPFARLVHHESATRGSEKNWGNRRRFEREKENLRRIHGTRDFIDPATNPLFGRDRSTPSLATLSTLPKARSWYRE